LKDTPLSSTTLLKACSQPVEQVLNALKSSEHGLSAAEVEQRLAVYGSNTLPQEKAPVLFMVLTEPVYRPTDLYAAACHC
jgi:magnesium-transporting ATPase (P-type)